MFCDQLGASSPTGQCLAGYYCEYGVDRNNPTGGNRTLVGGACVATGESVTLSLLSMSAIRCLNSILWRLIIRCITYELLFTFCFPIQVMRQVLVEFVLWVTTVPREPLSPSPVLLGPSVMSLDCQPVTSVRPDTTASWEQTIMWVHPVTQATIAQQAQPLPPSTPVRLAPFTIWPWPPQYQTVYHALGESFVPLLDSVLPQENVAQVKMNLWNENWCTLNK